MNPDLDNLALTWRAAPPRLRIGSAACAMCFRSTARLRRRSLAPPRAPYLWAAAADSGLALLMDVQRAGRFVRHHARHFGIEAGRVGACEGSSGGHLASLLGTLVSTGDPHDPDPVKRESARVQCVVARVPPVHLAG